MKKLKRIGAAFFAMALVLSLAACGDKGGKDEDIATILKTAAEKSETASSMDATIVMDIAMDMSMGEKKQEMNVKTTMDMNYFAKPMKAQIKIAATAVADQEVPEQTVYLVEADGVYNLYTQIGEGWSSQTLPTETITQYDPQANLQMYLDNASSFKSQGADTIDGVKAKKYTGVITGESMEKVVDASGVLDSFSVMTQGIDMSAMFKNMADLPITFWIDEAGYPIRYEMDMKDVLKAMFETIMEQLGDEAEGVKAEVSKAVITIDISNYNKATEFELPEGIATNVPAADSNAANADSEPAAVG